MSSGNHGFCPGDILIVRFPFTEIDSQKQRPVLLLNSISHGPKITLHIVAMITSKIEPPHFIGDLLIKKWKEAGLLNPGLLRLAKIATLDGALVRKKIGHIENDDLKPAMKLISEIFNYWV